MGAIIPFKRKDLGATADAVFENAKGKYDDIVLFGFGKEGELVYHATESLSRGEILFLLERFKLVVLNLVDNDYEDWE